MTDEELKKKCTERAKIFQQAMESCHSSSPIDCIEWFADRIAELEKENAELKAKIYGGGYEAVIMKKDADIILLEHLLKEQKELHNSVCDQLTHTHRNLSNQLTKAKEIIKEFMKYEINEYDGSLEIHFEELKKQAEQFISEVEK